MSINVPVPTEYEPVNPNLTLIPDPPSDVFARWRGHAQQWLAGAELSVTEALVKARRDSLILHIPHAIEERFDCLAALLAPGASWEEEEPALRDVLFDYARFFPLRDALIHGLARIEPLVEGGFVVRLYTIDRMGRERRETLFQDELEPSANELRDESRLVRDMVRKLLDSLPEAVELPDPDPEPKPRTGLDLGPAPELEPEPDLEPEIDLNPEPEPKVDLEPEPEPRPHSNYRAV